MARVYEVHQVLQGFDVVWFVAFVNFMFSTWLYVFLVLISS